MTLRNLSATRPSVTFNFKRSKKLDPRVTLTRASFAQSGTPIPPGSGTGTAGNEIMTFNVDVPRLTDHGLLIEEARTNILPNSLMNNAQWNSQLVDNSAIAPDGTLTASTVVPTAGQQLKLTSPVRTLPSAGEWTWSVFVQPSPNLTYFIMGFSQYSDSGNNGCNFDTTKTGINGDGIIPLSGNNANFIGATMDKNYPNGWIRLSITCNIVGPDLTGIIDVGNVNPSSGDGVSSIAYWQAQLEKASRNNGFPTSLIPTNGAEVTRAEDLCEITNDNLSSWYNSNEGTNVIEYNSVGYSRNGGVEVYLNYIVGNARFEFNVDGKVTGRTSAVQVWGDLSPALLNNVNNKVACSQSWLTGDGSFSSNGIDPIVATNNPSNPPYNPTRMAFGYGLYQGRGYGVNGYIQRFSYYPTRVSDGALEALTS